MKHIADRGYTDLQLNRHVNKDDELEKIYNEAGVEPTKERISYLVDERKLYISVEEEGAAVDETETTEEDNKEETTNEVEESNEEETQKENESEEVEENNEEEAINVEEEVKEDKETVEEEESNKEEATNNTKKNVAKSKTKNSKKEDEK